MKKANKQRDAVLRRNRERLRLHRRVKPEHNSSSWRDMETHKEGFNIFKFFSRAIPRLRKDRDKRDRLRMAQRRGDR